MAVFADFCFMENNIKGKVISITGASSGIGEASAIMLATQGAKVVLGARRKAYFINDKIYDKFAFRLIKSHLYPNILILPKVNFIYTF